MAQPPEVAHTSQRLRRAYQSAEKALKAEMASIEANPAQWQRRSRLRELQRSVERLTDSLDEQAADWFSRDFPTVYTMGAGAVPGEFAWTQADRFAITELAQESFDDLLAATKHVDQTTKGLVRALSKQQALLKMTTGQTAKQGGKDLAKLLRKHDIASVVYKNGARHGVGDYADMVIRTASAKAYNSGTLNFGGRTGVQWYEVADGADCGMAFHDDTDKANRSIRSAEECATYAIAHPRCSRVFLPRPELTSADEAKNAKSLISDEQQADQAVGEIERQEAQKRRAQSRRRVEARRARRQRTLTP
jgi:hypothetical protein